MWRPVIECTNFTIHELCSHTVPAKTVEYCMISDDGEQASKEIERAILSDSMQLATLKSREVRRLGVSD